MHAMTCFENRELSIVSATRFLGAPGDGSNNQALQMQRNHSIFQSINESKG